MRLPARHRPWSGLLPIGLAALAAVPAEAQVDPTWDHYKVYAVNPQQPADFTVELRDRITEATFQVLGLHWFATPAQKTILKSGETSPIHDPRTHSMWWRITEYPTDTTVTTTDQFGPQSLTIMRARYLVNPALKGDVFGPPPGGNHYKCYDCQGQQLNLEVTIDDSFGTWTGTVTYPFFFCDPVVKHVVVTGHTYPIVEPDQSYVCYQVEPPNPTHYAALIRDQFHLGQLEFYPARFLCVPALLTGVTGSGRDTWGRIKILYRR